MVSGRTHRAQVGGGSSEQAVSSSTSWPLQDFPAVLAMRQARWSL